MTSGVEYVIAAHGVILFAAVMYAVVVGMRTARLAREAELLARLTARREREALREAPAPTLEAADT